MTPGDLLRESGHTESGRKASRMETQIIATLSPRITKLAKINTRRKVR